MGSQQQKQRQRRRLSSLPPMISISSLSSSTLLLLCLLDLWLLSLSSLTAHALAPPHPVEFAEYEPLLKYRRRMNISFQYEPKFLSHEHCRFLNETACQAWDEMMGEMHPKSKPNDSNNQQRKLRRLTNINSGTLKVLIVLVYFPEHKDQVGTTLPTKEYFDTLYNGVGPSDINTVGGISEWLRYQSFNQYNVEFVVQDWQETQESEAFYAGGVSGKREPATMAGVFTPVLDKMDAAGFDWSPYDANGDGTLDSMIAIHSGFPAERGNPTCAPPDTERIWSQGHPGVPGIWTSKGGINLDGFLLASAYSTPGCTGSTQMAIHVHEYMHTFNVVDLYDADIDEGAVGIAGVGSFDIMCNPYGWKADSQKPGIVGPYSKFQIGWQEPIEITEPGFYAVQPAELADQVYKITHNFPQGEYLLIESRYAVNWANDWTGKGIVIWHVDEAAPLQSNRGYPGHPNWPSQHYRVSILQADGRYDIEQLVNYGDADDFWTKDAVLGPGPDTWPNTDSIQSDQTATGITIKVTTEASFIMQFQVSW